MSIAARRLQRVGADVSTPPSYTLSYGPNGTHWPSDTSRTGHVNVIDVACTWSAIGTAIASVNSTQAAAGTIIRVAPGTLTGSGDTVTSGATPALGSVGSASWTKKVLVAPRDGWGTVNIASGVRINDVHGVTFARINGTTIIFTNCGDMNWAQSRMTLGVKTFADAANVTNCNMYEMAMLDSVATENDACQYRASAGYYIKDCVWEGCYLAPLFRPTGSASHLDSLQMYGDGWYRGLTLRDCLFFGSQNCALQGGGYNTGDPYMGQPFVTLEHTILVCQSLATQMRYSIPSGVDYGSTQVINGPGEPGPWFSYDSYVLGSMHTTLWTTISNSYASYAAAVTNNTATTGAWVYQDWSSKTPAQFDAMVGPEPDNTYLASVWAS